MIMKDLKDFLARRINSEGWNQVAVNSEILDQVFPAVPAVEAESREVTAYQVNGTMVFVSKGGLTKPSRVIFVDLLSGESFLQEVE
ncbi:MAG: hypothetical protein HYZ83_01210 [Candidatus Omnitrophica bacterium]|nr:hypothetical protein [Candidatus Omnitrophota bacterium]